MKKLLTALAAPSLVTVAAAGNPATPNAKRDAPLPD